MLIKDTGAGGSITDLILESSLQKIGFECYDTTAITQNALERVTVSINRVTKGGGAVPICFPMPLQTLLEIASANEGQYRVVDASGLSVIGTVDVSNYGTLLLGDEYLQVSVSHTNANTFGVRIYAIEGNTYTNSSIAYNLNSVLAQTPKMVNVSDSYAVCLPIANFTKATFQYSDGRTATYTDIEMKMLCADNNDLVSTMGAGGNLVANYSYMNNYVLGISQVVNMTVQYSAVSKFYTMTDI